MKVVCKRYVFGENSVLDELHDMMHAISESHYACSWPCGHEAAIDAWIDLGEPTAPPPFTDRHGIVTPEFYQRLRELRETSGGWLYWNGTHQHVVFAPTPEWRKVRAEQEELWERLRRAYDPTRSTRNKAEARLAVVMMMARRDEEFWHALRDWELMREARRPPAASHRPVVATPVKTMVVKATPDQQAISGTPSLDPILADFIGRVRVVDDPLTVRDIVLNLRAAIRDELGLDRVTQWKNGPDIGRAD